jgi:hypothetical protein
MSIGGMLLRFTGLYIALLIAIIVIFALLELKGNSGANSGALIGSAFAACSWFCSKNRRVMTAGERRNAFLGLWGIDIAIQILVAQAVSAVVGTPLPLGALLIAVAFVGVLHGAVLYFVTGWAGKHYLKQVAKAKAA